MTRKWRNAAIVILILIAWDAASLYAQALFEQTEVFAGGQDDINTYRIPSLICTKNGTLLAFSEGRKDSSADGSPTDLVLKRSLGNAGMWTPENALLFHTGGRSRRNIMMWQPMQTLIHSLHGEAYMNPVPVIDRADGTIYLLVNDYPQPWADLPAEILRRRRRNVVQSGQHYVERWAQRTRPRCRHSAAIRQAGGSPLRRCYLQRRSWKELEGGQQGCRHCRRSPGSGTGRWLPDAQQAVTAQSHRNHE